MASPAKVILDMDTSAIMPLISELTEITESLANIGCHIPELPFEPFRTESHQFRTGSATEVLVRVEPTDSFLAWAGALRALHRCRSK